MALDQAAQSVKSTIRPFVIPVRVYYEDTDAGGIVYHATYLRFMERARTDFLRHLGFEHQRLSAEFGVQFVVTELTVKYLQPARLDDLLEVAVSVKSPGGARVVFAQAIAHNGQVLTRGTITVACLELDSMRPVPIPGLLREKMKWQT